MATFKREWFNSETDFVKANYLCGHNPKIHSNDIYDASSNTLKFKNGNFSKLIIDYNTDFRDKFMSQQVVDETFDMQKIKVGNNYWIMFLYQNKSIKHLININGTGSNLSGCFICPNLESIHFKTASKISMDQVSRNCSKLKSVIFDDASDFSSHNERFLEYSNSVTELRLPGIKVSLSISNLTALSREALINLFNDLAPLTVTATLTIGSTLLAKLTDEDKKIATDKGWTLA